MSLIVTDHDLRGDPGDRPGCPGGPGTAEPDRPPAALTFVELDSARNGRLGRRGRAVDADIVDRSQTTEYLNRTYESRKQPGLRLRLWINLFQLWQPICGTRRKSAFPPAGGPRSNR